MSGRPTPNPAVPPGERRTTRYGTAAARWAGVGPYYAMFPAAFAEAAVEAHTRPGDIVLDPFSGRGTALFAAATRGRTGWGVELNPVGWVYTKAKLQPAARRDVAARLEALAAAAVDYRAEAARLPEFYRHAFCPAVRAFLCAARDRLNWKRNKVDWTLAALLLVDLHGKREAALSNQMRQTKAFSPPYAVAWWTERRLTPPEIDPLLFMLKKLRWRYAKGAPAPVRSKVYLGDSLKRLSSFRRGTRRDGAAKLILTSPPYFRATNYHYDQWLRLWLLGGPELPLRDRAPWSNRFENRTLYESLLSRVFRAAAALAAPEATVLVRAGKDTVTSNAVLRALECAFPGREIDPADRPIPHCQTTLFTKNAGPRKGEVDFLIQS